MSIMVFEQEDIENKVREMVCKNCPYQSACELKYPCMTGAFDEKLKEVQNGKK